MEIVFHGKSVGTYPFMIFYVENTEFDIEIKFNNVGDKYITYYWTVVKLVKILRHSFMIFLQ